MKKSQRNLKLILGTAVIFIVAVSAAGLFVREINKQSETLHAQVTAVAKARAQQTQLTRLQKTVAETADDRATIDSFFLDSQADGIDFLNYIERLAEDKAVALETKSASETSRDTKQLLQVQYAMTGNRQQLEQFIKLLETIPYVSEVTTIELTKRTAVNWDAAVTIEVILLQNHDADT